MSDEQDQGVAFGPGAREPNPQAVSAVPASPPNADALSAAISLAAEAHRGQVDKGGQPYILHPLRVMLRLDGESERLAAVLHDTVEDCGLEIGLIRHRFGPVVADAVDALTRRNGESYMSFIERCGANAIARAVKWADLADNMDMTRIAEPSARDWDRWYKYDQARQRLNAIALAAQGIETGTAETPQEVPSEG